jgi:hypothetical protein
MKVVVVVAALLAGLALFLFTRGGWSPSSLEADAAHPPARSAAPVETPPEEPDAARAPEPRRAPAEAEAAGADEIASEPAGPRSRVYGRVTDERGAALADVPVSFSSVACEWSAEAEEDRYECTTDATGRFDLELPLPTCDWISMMIRPSRYHSLAGRDFGLAGGRNQDPLVEGDNDLGTITLQTTGAIAGTLRSANGAPLERARVTLDGEFPGGYVLGGSPDATGRYLIEHVPAGTYPLVARAEGFQSANLAGVTVRKLETSEADGLVLEPAKTVSGVVLDEAGAPVEGARLWGWPVGSGRGAGARTAADGSFVVHLPQDEPYRFGVEKDGFLSIEDDHDEGLLYEPGASGITIRLQRALQTTFRVVDARTGEPVERFGFKVDRKPDDTWGSSTEREELPIKAHPGGELTTSADPARHAYSIQAPGYGPQREPVVHEAPDAPRQTIRLAPEGRIRGRVVFEGRPVPKATARVGRAPLPRDPAAAEDDSERWYAESDYDLDEYTGRLRMVSTDADGAFELGELAAGTYEVELSASVGAPRTLDGLRVEAGETLDLGDVELAAGASVHGHVLVGFGASAPGLEVLLDDTWDENGSTVGADERYRFDGLAPGEHSLVVEDVPGVVLDMEPVTFELREGEDKELDLDLRPWQPGVLVVRVVDGSGPVAGAHVKIAPVGGNVEIGLGATDAAGTVREDVRGDQPLAVGVLSARDFTLGFSPEPVTVAAGGEETVEIRIDSGQLDVVFPDDFRLPDDGAVDLSLHPASQPNAWYGRVRVSAVASPLGSWELRWTGPRVELGRVLASEFVVRAEVMVLENVGGAGRWTRLGTTFEGRVTVESGRRAECSLTRD